MKKLAAVLIFAAMLSAGRAQTNAPVRALSLQDCITEALKHNFDVQVSRYNPQIDLYNVYSTYGGWDPLFKFSGTHNYNTQPSGLNADQNPTPAVVTEGNSFNSELSGILPEGLTYDLTGNVYKNNNSYSTVGTNILNGVENSGGSIGITMAQPLLKNFWIDATRLQIKVAKNNLKISEQGLRAQLITTISAVENAYYAVSAAQGQLTVHQDALKLDQTQLDQDRQRLEIGTLAQLSVQQDEAQVATDKSAVITAESDLAGDLRTLKGLITDDYAKWQATDIELTDALDAPRQLFDLQDSWNKGLTLRPDLLQAQITLEQQGIQLKFDRNQIYPELDLIGSFGYNGSGQEYNDVFRQYADQNSPFYSYGAKLSIPLGNVTARNTLKSDKVTEQQDLLKLKQIEQTIMVQIDNAIGDAKSDFENVAATKEARVYAEAALDAEQKTYAVGKATTFEVLQYQIKLTNARSAEIAALVQYQQDLCNLAQQEGSTLQRRGLDIEVK